MAVKERTHEQIVEGARRLMAAARGKAETPLSDQEFEEACAEQIRLASEKLAAIHEAR